MRYIRTPIIIIIILLLLHLTIISRIRVVHELIAHAVRIRRE
jgi:hypothetical protein